MLWLQLISDTLIGQFENVSFNGGSLRKVCNSVGQIVQWNYLGCWKCCLSALSTKVGTSRAWLLGTWKVVGVTKELSFKFCLIII